MLDLAKRRIRTLRLRASDFASAANAARVWGDLVIPTREGVGPGERVHVEVSFGPLADEVVLMGTVTRTQTAQQRSVGVRLDESQQAKLDYVAAVLDGGREASARRHRRLPSDMPVSWRAAGPTRSSRLRDISAGGAFILGHGRELPQVGDEIEVVLHPVSSLPRVCVSSGVSWIHAGGRQTGFGVSFRPADSAVACQLTEVVRHHEKVTVFEKSNRLDGRDGEIKSSYP
jgi:hypothetical protein